VIVLKFAHPFVIARFAYYLRGRIEVLAFPPLRNRCIRELPPEDKFFFIGK